MVWFLWHHYSQKIHFFWKFPSFPSLLMYLWAQWCDIWQPTPFSCTTSAHFPIWAMHDREQIMQKRHNAIGVLTTKSIDSFWKLNLLLMQAKLTVGTFEGMLFLWCFVNPHPRRTCILVLPPQEMNSFVWDQRVVQLPRPICRMNTDGNL